MANIDQILSKWYNIKEQLAFLRQEERELKATIHEIMTRNDTNRLSGTDFVCSRTVRERSSIHKEDVPKEIWDQYVENMQYAVLLLKKKKIE